jgi:subtilisin family serine protease
MNNHKAMLLTVLVVLCAAFLAAGAINQSQTERPLFAPDLIKIKLTGEADLIARLPQGLYAEARSFGINELDQLMSQNGGITIIRAHRRVKDAEWESKTGFDRWFLIRLDGKVSVQTAIESFAKNRYIEDAIPEYYAYAMVTPNDTYYANNWGHNNTAQLPVYSGSSHSGAGVGTIGFDSDAPLAWDLSQGYGLSSIIIAVIDSGVDTAHPDLRLVTGYDYGDNDSNPMDNSAEPGHGTCCAGVAAGKANNGLGITGVAGGCSVMPLKVADSAGSMAFTSIENAITHAADNNADVISMSLGAEGGTAEGSSPSTDTALYYAYNAGVSIFAATANSNASTMAYPANHTSVISVGAASPTGQRKSTTSSDGEYWWGSNYGSATQDAKEAVDIMAPTILPATDISGTGNGYETNSDYYLWFNGTSCATPYAAGCAALILSNTPTLTPAQLRSVMTATATDMTADGGAGWDRYTGYGMVNVYNAISSLTGYNPPRNLAATAGNTVVTLTWQAPVTGTPTGYKIFKNSALLTTVTGLTYTDTAVTNSTTYSYYLKAVYSGGESNATATVTATPNIITSVIIGAETGITGTTAGCPVNVYYQSLHGQSVYLASELNAVGLTGPVQLTQIGFYIGGLPSLAMPNFVVRMGHTTSTNVASWIASSGLTTVWSSTSYLPAATGWNMLTLTTPFTWNGTGNIVIDTAYGLIGSYTSTGTVQYSTVTSGYRFVRSDTVDQTGVFTGGSTATTRPNLKIVFASQPTQVPEIAVAPASLAYGSVKVGNTGVQNFTIQNSGTAALTGSITTPTGYTVALATRGSGAGTAKNSNSLGSSASSDRNTLSINIAAGITNTYNLTFAPTTATTYNGNVTITSNDSDEGTTTIAITGSGYTDPNISVNYTTMDASVQSGGTATDTIIISNTGSNSLTYSLAESPAVAWFAASPTSGSVAGSGTQTVTGTFTSTGLSAGNYTTTLVLTSNDPDTPTINIAVTLTVTAANTAPTIALPDSWTFAEDGTLAVDFGSYVADAETADSGLTLTRSGNTNVTVSISGMNVTFGAAANWNGTETVTFTVSDGALTASDAVSVIVTSVNDTPTIVLPDSWTFAKNGTLTVDLSPYVADIETADSGLTITRSGNTNVTATISGRSVTFGAAANWYGTETLTFTVSDGSLSASDTANIIVTNTSSEAIIGTGTSSNGTTIACPINVYYKSMHTQAVYKLSELNAAGMTGSKQITQIGFYVSGLPTLAMPSYIIRMGHTTSNTASGWLASLNLTTVWSSTSYQPTATGWNMITLTTPFTWNGTSNLVIDTAFGLMSNYAQSGTTRYTTTTTGFRYVRSDTVNETNVFSGGSTSNYRPNLKIVYASRQADDPQPPLEQLVTKIAVSRYNPELGFMKLEWKPVGNATWYQIWKKEDPNGDFTFAGETTDNFWRDTELSSAKRFYKVIATDKPLAH